MGLKIKRIEVRLTTPAGKFGTAVDFTDGLNVLRADKTTFNGINAELQMRPALSAGCLFFVVIGCPIGIWFGRSDYLSAFIICFLPIVFVYYPLQLCCTNLAKDGKLNPILALWIANAAIGLWALLLFRKLLKN